MSGIMRFRVLHGIHLHGGKTFGKGQPDGDIVESESDLVKMFNSAGSAKFERLGVGEDDSIESLMARKAEIDEKLAFLAKKDRVAKAAASAEVSPSSSSPTGLGSNDDTLDGGEGGDSQGDEFSGMSFVELKDYAETHEIDITGKRSKAEILEVIRGGSKVTASA